MKLTREEIMATESSLSDAISQVLGMPVKMHFYPITDDKLGAGSDNLPLSGPAYFMFQSLTVGSFGSISVTSVDSEDVNLAWFEANFAYKHQDGGTNGCTVGILGKSVTMVLRNKWDFCESKLTWKAVI